MPKGCASIQSSADGKVAISAYSRAGVENGRRAAGRRLPRGSPALVDDALRLALAARLSPEGQTLPDPMLAVPERLEELAKGSQTSRLVAAPRAGRPAGVLDLDTAARIIASRDGGET